MARGSAVVVLGSALAAFLAGLTIGRGSRFDDIQHIAPTASTAPAVAARLPRPPPPPPPPPLLPAFRSRDELAAILQGLNLTVGAELGVLRGKFAKHTLDNWPACRKYVLVDLWEPQRNYEDLNNMAAGDFDRVMGVALRNVARWRQKVEVCRNFTTVCAARYADDTFDYVYVDARHDRKGVAADLHAWWPKLRRGGVLAGHDYVAQWEGPQQTKQNWTVNFDGTVDRTGLAVKGAVDDFAREVGRQVVVSYAERPQAPWWDKWPTWAMRK